VERKASQKFLGAARVLKHAARETDFQSLFFSHLSHGWFIQLLLTVTKPRVRERVPRIGVAVLNVGKNHGQTSIWQFSRDKKETTALPCQEKRTRERERERERERKE